MKRICPCESCQGEWPLFESSCRTCCQSLSSRPLLVYALSSQEWFSWNSVLCEGISNLVVSCSCILCGIYEISVSSRSFCLQALELLSTYQFGKLTAWRCDAPTLYSLIRGQSGLWRQTHVNDTEPKHFTNANTVTPHMFHRNRCLKWQKHTNSSEEDSIFIRELC